MDIELDSLDVQARLRAGDLLADRGVYGIVWLDDELTVVRRYGVLTDFIEEGVCATQSLAPLVGLEDDILQLSGEDAVRVPNVTMIRGKEPWPRLNIVVYRFAAEGGFLVTLGVAGTDNGLEIELSRQVRARLMAEAEVMSKSRELARTNAELRMANNVLEQFAAIVTHDLKAPMRALGYLVEDIERATSADGGGAVSDKLGDLRRQTARMSSMLSSLLDYASAGPSQTALEHVDTRELVDAIVRSLPRGDLEVEIRGDWPKIETLAAPLDLAMRNLVENAIKHHDRSKGLIAIACDDGGDVLKIAIEDDGPGIGAEHGASIFLPFRSLDGRGTGMGLAIAKKMVEAVGGSIALCSAVPRQRGARFEIRWPKHIVA